MITVHFYGATWCRACPGTLANIEKALEGIPDVQVKAYKDAKEYPPTPDGAQVVGLPTVYVDGMRMNPPINARAVAAEVRRQQERL